MNCCYTYHIHQINPSNYFFFPNLKKWHTEQRLAWNKDVIINTNVYFVELDKPYYTEGIKKSVSLSVKIEKVNMLKNKHFCKKSCVFCSQLTNFLNNPHSYLTSFFLLWLSVISYYLNISRLFYCPFSASSVVIF